MKNRIFILQTKQSKKYDDTTYCIGGFKLGTPYMEFIMGETNSDKEYKRGDETSYIYSADYTQNLQNALDWLSKVE